MKLYVLNDIRTNNFQDENMVQKIQTLWTEASRKLENWQGIVYGVYSDYESDYTGDYSLRVAVEEPIAEDSLVIPAESYTVFQVDTSDEQGMIKAWSKVWELERNGSLQRAYSYDFEKYYPNGDVEIHIAIK
ncbi:GyrI-like domain-containing protein [Brevibacillus sp. TJ4]|uniref:GyrI-like domain-containing protein n=1 Tax=Brevibacillus sp. TJ4 TaxID=3234853 RepID=UPI0037D4D243